MATGVNAGVSELVRAATRATNVHDVERIQSLWSGYGELSRVRLEGGDAASVVVKWARPPKSPRPRDDVSDARKRRSYEVEGHFYRTYAPRCGHGCRVPRLLAHHTTEGEWVLVLEDLDACGFRGRTWSPRGDALEACLRWLASFHATFLGVEPAGLWDVGTYWHLATRQEELRRMTDPRLARDAAAIDSALSSARFRTLVHGDAKPANFCFSSTRAPVEVAAVDFQYVGGGVGVKDVAYLLEGLDDASEAHALDVYFDTLRGLTGAEGDAIEREWRALYPLAQDDFRRFLDGWQR